MSLSWNSIISLVTYPILSPFYIIAFKKWHSIRNDWIFSLRYSLESLILVFTSIFITHICVIRSLLYDLGYVNDKKLADMSAIVYTLYWIIFCTVYYRTNLILLSFRQSQARLNQIAITLIPRKHCSSYILLSIVICGAFFNLIFLLVRSRLAYWIWAIQWFFMYLVGIILFIVVKCKRVKELFGCLYECYILFGIIISHWLVRIFTPNDTNIIRFEGYVYSHIISLFILYYTLYFLHKHEYKSEYQLERRASFTSIGSTSKTPSDEQNQHNNNVHINIETHETLFEYLNNKNNYEIFSKYLAYCWCLENLLFVEKVCVFYWLVNMKMNISNENKQLQIGKQIYSMKFEFLKNVYSEYEEIINKCNDCFENQRDILWSICHNIYNQYINDNSMDQ
eukprot:422828_1